PSIAWGPGIKAGTKNSDIVGGLDYMATFAKLAGVSLPENDRDGKPIIFDSYDMSPVLFGTGKSERKSWFYFTENELTPGAARVGNYKAVFNLRGDDGAKTGGLAVDSNLGWKGPESYTATVPQVFDLWQDPQERYDIFMNNITERTWTLVTINAAIQKLMKTYVQYPPRPLQSETYTGPFTISRYQKFQHGRDEGAKDGFELGLPTGNERTTGTGVESGAVFPLHMTWFGNGRAPMHRALVDRRAVLASMLASTAAVPFVAGSAWAQGDPLPSWNDGPPKQAILSFVSAVTREGSPDFVPAPERIATFDNDGTLWCEQPMYVQLAFALDRVKALSNQHPEWKEKQPFKAVLENDMAALAQGGEKGLLDLVVATHAGMSTAD